MPLFEYYNTGDDNDKNCYGTYWYSQTFTPAIAHMITSVKLLLHRTGLPGTITVSIRATDVNGYPTGADLCSGTTDGNTLPTVSPYEWREITLGAGYQLSASTKYAIVARAPGGNTSNYFSLRSDSTSPTYDGGAYVYSTDSGSTWNTGTADDLMFEDWGTAGQTYYGSATLSGVGTLTCATMAIHRGAATLSGVGALSALANPIRRSSATLSGVGALSAIGNCIRNASATLSGVGTLTVEAIKFPKRWLAITMAPIRQWLAIDIRGMQYLEIIPKLRQWLSITWRR